MTLHLSLRWSHEPASALLTAAPVQAKWDRVNASGMNCPFLSASAVGGALRELGTGRERLCMASAPDGAPVAMVLMAPAGRFRWQTFQPSQLPLGALVAARGLGMNDLAASLMRSSALPLPLTVSFTQMDPLQLAREDNRPDTRFDDYISTAWLELQGTFADYWAARGKNLRQNMRKQRNKLADSGLQPSLLILQDRADMAGAIDRYGELESGGWKAGQGTAVNRDNAQGRFYLRLLEEAADKGEALVTEYRFGNKTVAMNLGLLRNQTWVVLKTAYDESIDKSLSPASLLREEELQQFFATAQVQRMEYFGRLMEWHTRLTDKQRTLYHVTAYRWPWIRQFAERRATVPVAPLSPQPQPQPQPSEG